MKMRVTATVLAVALAAGVVHDAADSAGGPASGSRAAAAPILLAKAPPTSPPKTTRPAPKRPPRPAPKVRRKVTAYYFHGEYRCVSCRTIEAWAENTIRTHFASDIKAGRLEWRTVNIDAKGNERYRKDYQLFAQSVVLSDTRNNKQTRWKNLVKVWPLLGDEAAFRSYVREEVAAYLEGA